MSEKVVEISDSDFEEKVLGSNLPVMLDMWAPWCGPCRMVAPIVEELSEEYGDKVSFFKLNIDENPETAARFGVTSIPTMLFFKDGEELAEKRMVGAESKDDYKEVLEDVAP